MLFKLCCVPVLIICSPGLNHDLKSLFAANLVEEGGSIIEG